MIIGKLIYNKAEEGEAHFNKDFDSLPYVTKLDVLSDLEYEVSRKYNELRGYYYSKIKENIA